MDEHNPLQEEEQEELTGSVLGPSKSKEQLRKEAEEAKIRAKEQRRLEKQTARETRKSMPKGDNTVTWVMVGILGVIVLCVAVFLVLQLRGGRRDMAADSGHFQNLDELPELSEEGLKGVVLEAYYTNDKSLCVVLKFANAYNTNQYLDSLEVKLRNEAGETIATGYSDNIEDFYVPPEDYATFTFYILEEYVQIHDDPLTTLTYDITTTGTLEDPQATVNPQYTTTSAASTAGTTAATETASSAS